MAGEFNGRLNGLSMRALPENDWSCGLTGVFIPPWLSHVICQHCLMRDELSVAGAIWCEVEGDAAGPHVVGFTLVAAECVLDVEGCAPDLKGCVLDVEECTLDVDVVAVDMVGCALHVGGYAKGYIWGYTGGYIWGYTGDWCGQGTP